MGFKSVGKRTQNCYTDSRERRWRQSKPTDRWYLVLVVKRLCCINCLNACVTNCDSFKSCGVVPSFYIKTIKRITLYPWISFTDVFPNFLTTITELFFCRVWLFIAILKEKIICPFRKILTTCAFDSMDIFHFVEIQTTYCLDLQNSL